MKYLLIFTFLLPFTVNAQVRLCTDDKGKKTYTEAQCEEIGMKQTGLIADIQTKPKHCYDLLDQINNQKKQAAKLKATPSIAGTNEGMAIIIEGQAEQREREYKKECAR